MCPPPRTQGNAAFPVEQQGFPSELCQLIQDLQSIMLRLTKGMEDDWSHSIWQFGWPETNALLRGKGLYMDLQGGVAQKGTLVRTWHEPNE